MITDSELNRALSESGFQPLRLCRGGFFDTYETEMQSNGHRYHVTSIPPTMVDYNPARNLICWIDGYVAYSCCLDDDDASMDDLRRDFLDRIGA